MKFNQRHYSRSGLMVAMLVSLLCLPLMGNAEANHSGDPVNETVLPFFEALQDGDVQAVEFYLDGGLARSMRPLLRDNQEYPELLRKYYNGAEFSVGKINGSKSRLNIDVNVSYPSGRSMLLVLTLIQRNDGDWKIIKQIEERAYRVPAS